MRKILIILFGLFLPYTWAQAATYTFMAPPRQNRATATRIYAPIAAYLTRATGASFVFHYTSNWLTYMQEVHNNSADLYFDGPSMIGWRIAHWHDVPVARLTGHLRFVVVTTAAQTKISDVKQLIGRTVCAFSPPNLATLTLDSWFPNPERQPYIVVIHSLPAALKRLLAGQCDATILPTAAYHILSAKIPGSTKVIFKAPPLPNQAFSVSAALPAALRARVTAALLAQGGARATAPLRALFGGHRLIKTQTQTYTPYRKLLRVMVGF